MRATTSRVCNRTTQTTPLGPHTVQSEQPTVPHPHPRWPSQQRRQVTNGRGCKYTMLTTHVGNTHQAVLWSLNEELSLGCSGDCLLSINKMSLEALVTFRWVNFCFHNSWVWVAWLVTHRRREDFHSVAR